MYQTVIFTFFFSLSNTAANTTHFPTLPSTPLMIEMEIIPEGIHFRLVQDDELPAILNHLKQYLPEAIKVL